MRLDIRNGTFLISLAAVTIAAASAFAAGSNGTTLAASKTIDICEEPDGSWLYSGEVSVWNEGTIDTVGLNVYDCVQNQISGPRFTDQYCAQLNSAGQEIAAGTTLETATTFPYSFSGAALDGTIRNRAKVTILNHSSRLGKAFGPEPKATWTGGQPPPCVVECGCTYTQGYWGSKPDVVWPAPYSRDNYFWSTTAADGTVTGQTWQGVLDTPPPKGSGYYILAHQYIAAVLNVANGACEPDGIADVIAQAAAWFAANLPDACSTSGSCGLQKTWAAILDDYNNGVYPGGPAHCEDTAP